MRVVVALGGNALLRRGQPMTVEISARTSGLRVIAWRRSASSTS